MTDIRAMWTLIGLVIFAGAVLMWKWTRFLLPEESKNLTESLLNLLEL